MESKSKSSAHRKQLAQILRYIASMHQTMSNAGDSDASFVRDTPPQSDFFQKQTERDESNGVLFSTSDFRQLLSIHNVSEKPLFPSPPFSFYAAPASPTRKRTLAGALKASFSFRDDNKISDKSCWLRITRLTDSQVSKCPAIPNQPASLETYLHDWKKRLRVGSLDSLLTIHNIQQAPKIPPTFSALDASAIKRFLDRYLVYLQRKAYRRSLEPIYNALFEYTQHQDHNQELVWGLGHANVSSTDGKHVSGPLLEVMVEVELAPDGALLVRPREHTGVSLNRQVVTAIANMYDSQGVLSQLYRAVAEMDAASLSPGQPETYSPILKRMAVELSPGGRFHVASQASESGELSVSESWCLFVRPKPSTVWARDATVFADKIMQKDPPDLPLATWSLTHGPGAFEDIVHASRHSQDSHGILNWFYKKMATEKEQPTSSRPLFPLPTSEAQDQIAELLVSKNYPVCVVEGPPGTGKTHSIANVMCAYLCQGKRVLATSKNAPALSVLRERLPASVRDLCVDVSTSELTGMRQLQQTVERLADRVACANVSIESEKCELLKRSITKLEDERRDIDHRVARCCQKVRLLLHSHDGADLIQLAHEMMDGAAWMLHAIPRWSLKELVTLHQRVSLLVIVERDPITAVGGIPSSPMNGLVQMARAKAGAALSSLSVAAKDKLAAFPFFGAFFGMEKHWELLMEEFNRITINGAAPTTPGEWTTVARALEHAQSVSAFHDKYWKTLVQREGWPDVDFHSRSSVCDTAALLNQAIRLKRLSLRLKVDAEVSIMAQCRAMGAQRSRLSKQIQQLAEEIVDATVVTELSRSFSPDAQSALIRFAQIAGKNKFSRSSQPSSMTDRQKRRRKEYLDAFNQCCRYIPCWILTTSQISDYLPPQECLFDLVIVDESSQSDITTLPGLLRGKQWLIVGDGKQVSPTECFISEETLENLRAALPACPLESMLLPGQSFFDLCSQAFPKGRVVLKEHFRCAEDIISFSNYQFYDGRLIPLRLPTKSERLDPVLIDIRLTSGSKVGKVNEKEAEKIVAMVVDITSQTGSPRSIGVISLLGDEQSRLIRGRLLDAIGPEKMSRHAVLVGDPPSFQGAERDIVFLSMVCSRGAVPTQNQLLHAQRANVALSRARDRCVLVRSIGMNDIPSQDDIKVPIIEFFQAASSRLADGSRTLAVATKDDRQTGHSLMKQALEKLNLRVTYMGGVWKNALCVEDRNSEQRAAVLVDCDCESEQEWQRGYSQQMAIERVGWRCLRVDMLSFLYHFVATMADVKQFLANAGIYAVADERLDGQEVAEDFDNRSIGNEIAPAGAEEPADIDMLVDDRAGIHAAAVDDTAYISNDDASASSSTSSALQATGNATQFGEVVNLDFLMRSKPDSGRKPRGQSSSVQPGPKRARREAGTRHRGSSVTHKDDDDESAGSIQAEEDSEEEASFDDEGSQNSNDSAFWK